jgi:hypothetical protein
MKKIKLKKADLIGIAEFHQIIRNYLRMQKIEKLNN